MGHLINPSAMRLGWFCYWEDIWFVNYVYYPEFLHLILKIRIFLAYFFSLKFFEFGGLLYSHFIVLKKLRSIMIRFFFFNGILDEMTEDFFLDCRQFFFEDEIYVTQRDFFFLSPRFMNSFRLIMLLKLFSFFTYDYLTNLNIYEFIKIVGILNYDKLKRQVLENANFNFKVKGQRSRFLFLFFIFTQVLKDLSLNLHIKHGHNTEADYVFLRVLLVDVIFGKFFAYASSFLQVLLSSLTPNYNFSYLLKWIILENEEINAKFLSRYIARKLQQGYKIGQIVSPIKNELKRVSAFVRTLKTKSPSYIKPLNKMILKTSFVRLLNFLLNIYKIEFYKYCNINYCWLNFDSINLFYWMLNKFILAEELVGLSFFYFRYKGGFSLFFNVENFFMRDFFNTNFLYGENFSLVSNIEIVQYAYDRIYLSLYTFNILFVDYIKSFFADPFLKTSIFFFNNFLKYSFWIHNYILKNDNVKKELNYTLNDKSKSKSSSILGFKFKFTGRFSRRQRASCILYSIGSVPSNTLKANIEYGIYTIPLKNSAISVKIWICKSKSLLHDPVQSKSLYETTPR